MRNHRISVRVAVCAAIGLAAVSATGARASSFCDPELGECPPDPGPLPPPTLPLLPTKGVSVSGSFHIQRGTVRDYQLVEGGIRDDQYFTFGGGPYRPIGGDNTLTFTGSSTSIALAQTVSPLAAISVVASATPARDPVFSDIGLVARGGLLLTYLVVLHANNQAAANSLTSLLSTSGGIASISGDYSVGGTYSFWSSVSASTGVNELDASLGGSFYKACSLIGYGGTAGDCGSGSYVLPLNFVSGSAYANGSGLDFISAISLSADANAGPVNLGYYIGTAFAYIDPVINFANGIDPSQFSLSVGTPPNAVMAAVPEPANWAMMIAGFGLVGAVSRRRRTMAAVLA